MSWGMEWGEGVVSINCVWLFPLNSKHVFNFCLKWRHSEIHLGSEVKCTEYFTILIVVLYIYPLQIIRSRIIKHRSAGAYSWNHFPGRLKTSAKYSRHLPLFPFFQLHLGVDYNQSKFTAVIFAKGSVLKDSSPLCKLIKHIAQSQHVDRVR